MRNPIRSSELFFYPPTPREEPCLIDRFVVVYSVEIARVLRPALRSFYRYSNLGGAQSKQLPDTSSEVQHSLRNSKELLWLH